MGEDSTRSKRNSVARE